MIKSNMGEVEINGTTTIILAEFSSLTKGMVESLTENYGKEMVEQSYKRGLMSEKEIRKESLEILSDILEILKNHIKED